MNQITILTPQGDVLAEIEQGSIEEFCESSGLICKKVTTNTYVGYSPQLEQTINSLNVLEPVVIRHIRPDHSLEEEIRGGLEQGRCVVVEPSAKSLRHFITNKGFVSAMYRVADHLTGMQVLVPPGLYGKRYLCALQPI